MLGRIGLHIHREEGGRRHIAECRLAAAAVNKHRDRHGDSARRLHHVDHLFDRAARRHDVLDNQHALALTQGETAAECHLAVHALREDCTGSECLSRLMRKQDAARHGANDRLNPRILELLRHRLTELLRILRMLQHVKLLHIVRAMQPRCQEKMPVHNRARLNQQCAHLILRHHISSNSFKTASAAARGSSAA